MRFLLFVALFGAFSSLAAVPPCLQDVWLRGTTDKPALSYAPGEPMVFTIEMYGMKGEIPKGEWELHLTRSGDDGQVEKQILPLPLENNRLVYKTSLNCDGFVRIYAQVLAKGGKFRVRENVGWPRGSIFFDGGAGVNWQNLRGIPEPEDFDAFWAKRRERLEKLPIVADLKPVSSNQNGVCFAVSVNCAGGRPSTFYMSVPKNCLEKGMKAPAYLGFWGYSGDRKPTRAGISPTTINIDFNPHGFELEREDEYYKEFYQSIRSGRSVPKVDQKTSSGYCFDYEKNSLPETAYFAGFTWRLMRALQYVKSTPWWDHKRLEVVGESQGGLQAIWAAGLDKDVTHCSSTITWCCDFGGTELKRLRGDWYIRHTKALDYYDAINIAKRIPSTCKVVIPRAGLGDYICPPSGLACLYNNITAPKTITWYQGSEHGYPKPPRPDETFTFSDK